MRQEFYITKNKYSPILSYSYTIILLLIFFHFKNEPKNINLEAIYRAFILITILFFYCHYRLNRTNLIFDTNSLFINHKQYKYSDIKKYWIESTYAYRMPGFLSGYYRPNKVLCIKLKKRFSLYYFPLKYFSPSQQEKIIEALKKASIKNEEGILLGLNEIFPSIIFLTGLFWIVKAFF